MHSAILIQNLGIHLMRYLLDFKGFGAIMKFCFLFDTNDDFKIVWKTLCKFNGKTSPDSF